MASSWSCSLCCHCGSSGGAHAFLLDPFFYIGKSGSSNKLRSGELGGESPSTSEGVGHCPGRTPFGKSWTVPGMGDATCEEVKEFDPDRLLLGLPVDDDKAPSLRIWDLLNLAPGWNSRSSQWYALGHLVWPHVVCPEFPSVSSRQCTPLVPSMILVPGTTTILCFSLL